MTKKEARMIAESANNLLNADLVESSGIFGHTKGYRISICDVERLEPFLQAYVKIEWTIGNVTEKVQKHIVCGIERIDDSAYVYPSNPNTFKYEFYEMMQEIMLCPGTALKHYRANVKE